MVEGKAARSRMEPGVVDALRRSAELGNDAQAFQLCSTDPTGAPRIALLSSAEIFAVDSESLRIVIWAASRTARNLGDRPSGLLCFVHEGAFVSLTLSMTDFEVAELHGRSMLIMAADVELVDADRVPYAEVTTGIQFRTLDEAVQERWAHTRELLRQGI